MNKKILIVMLGVILFLTSCQTTDPITNPPKTNGTIIEPTVPPTKEPTPDVPTNVVDEFEGYYEVLDGVYVNHHPGVYEDDLVLDFKLKDEDGLLYYSIDYTDPNIYYEEPFVLSLFTDFKLANYPLTTSVDAILASDTGGKCVSNMYINNIQKRGKYVLSNKQQVVTIKYIDSNGVESKRSLTYLNTSYDIPIVSLSMPYDNWFGSKNGFYNKIREEIEHRVNLEFFDFEYKEYFYRNSKIKLGGNWSLGYPQRTLNLNFNKDEYGNKNEKVTTHIFGDRMTLGNSSQRLTDLTRFRLHNGGNCFEERTGFNDAIIQKLMYGTNVSTTAYRPCITYLNGEYWGIYSLREHYSDTYFKDNYDVDKDDVALYELKGGVSFDDGNDEYAMEHLDKINNYLNNDFSNDAIYENFIDKYVDVDSLIDCFIAHSFAGNWDFVGNYNNLKFWRTVNVDPENPYADGRLRFCIHDVDFAFEDHSNFLDPNHANSYTKFNIYRKLLENDNFKIRFYERAKELLETNLSYANAEKVVYSMVEEVMYYKSNHMKRWGNTTSYTEWRNNADKVLNYIKERNKSYLSMLEDTFDL